MAICKICGHDKELHTVHISPDHTGQKVKHVGCHFTVASERLDFGLGEMPIKHSCSCHGVKENTYLMNGIKKYQKFLRELPKTSSNIYRRKEVESQIRRLRKSIKENPLNLLHWQRKQPLLTEVKQHD